LNEATGNPCVVFRLPGVFGKWCKPNYNSVVATFCNNIARDLPISINNRDVKLSLVYVDDVIDEFVSLILKHSAGYKYCEVYPMYEVTLGQLAGCIESFKYSRKSLVTEKVGHGFMRSLYATYISYLPPEKFTYELPVYSDPRGKFVEMLKTKDSGQFSYFTAHPGVTRGGHYHHTKSEKFLVIRGQALFRFRNVINGERYEVSVEGGVPRVVETIPGWTHDITNIGNEELVVMLWANEIFDRSNPDTIADKV
jgi:UDP-2-acetamido-2,6-beta-L-arabino-hexul-4-ose reductase